MHHFIIIIIIIIIIVVVVIIIIIIIILLPGGKVRQCNMSGCFVELAVKAWKQLCGIRPICLCFVVAFMSSCEPFQYI